MAFRNNLFVPYQNPRKLGLSIKVMSLPDPLPLIDEILNAVLFLLIGIEVILVFSDASLLLFGLAAIPLVLAARAISVGVPMLGLQHLSPLSPGSLPILVLGGVRGCISIALALSVPSGPYKETIIAAASVIAIALLLLWIL